MKKKFLKISILWVLSIVFISRSFGQEASGDTSYLQTAIVQTSANFYKSIGQQSRLYNGHEYLPYDPHIKGNAYFPYEIQSWEPGEVNYDGIVYKNLLMRYDVYKDVVVVLLYNKFSMFSLLNNKVHDFSFANHHFVRVAADSVSNNSGIATGFYDQLYAGKTELLARREKSIQNSSSVTSVPESSFISTNNYYIKKRNAYYKVSGKGSVLSVLKDKKSALQQYIRENNIVFGKEAEDAMIKVVLYYDHLTN